MAFAEGEQMLLDKETVRWGYRLILGQEVVSQGWWKIGELA